MIHVLETAPCAAHRTDGLGIPDEMLHVIRAAAERDMDISCVRESDDGIPIGWILRLSPNVGDECGATMHDQPLQRGSTAQRTPPAAYLTKPFTPATIGDVYDLISTTAPSPYDVSVPNGYDLADIMSAAVQNGWSIRLDYRAESRPSNERFGLPNMLTLECSAFDYENAATDHWRESVQHSLTLYELEAGEDTFPTLASLIDEHGYSKSTPEAFFDAVLNPAPYTVLTRQFDEEL